MFIRSPKDGSNNMDHIASYLETAPLGAFFMVIAHLGGAFLGGLGTSIFL